MPCMRIRLLFACLLITFVAQHAFPQETQPEPKKYLPPLARIAAAKTVFLQHLKGTDIAFNIIQAGFESWPLFTIVDSPDKADLLVQIVTPEDTSGGNSVSGKSSSGSNAQASADQAQFAPIPIVKMTVLDAKTRVFLYSASERTKNAWREKNRTDSQIEMAQKIFDSFRKRIEAQAAKSEKEPEQEPAKESVKE